MSLTLVHQTSCSFTPTFKPKRSVGWRLSISADVVVGKTFVFVCIAREERKQTLLLRLCDRHLPYFDILSSDYRDWFRWKCSIINHCFTAYRMLQWPYLEVAFTLSLCLSPTLAHSFASFVIMIDVNPILTPTVYLPCQDSHILLASLMVFIHSPKNCAFRLRAKIGSDSILSFVSGVVCGTAPHYNPPMPQ